MALLEAATKAALKKAFQYIAGAITVITGIKNFRTIQKLKDQGQDILATKTAQGGKIPIIYGRRRVGSTLLYMDTDSGNSKELFVIYGLCLGEVDSIELDTIEINGVPLSDTKVFRQGYYAGSDKISSGAGSLNTASQLGNVNSTTSSGRSGLDPSKRYRMVLNAHHGADDQTVDPMLNASQSTKFTSNHRLRGIAYIAASFQYDTKGMFTSVPELTVVVKGRKLYDPRLDGSITGGTGSHRIADKTTYEWSNNAALTLLDYMHQDYGKGLSASLIDLQSFQTAANTADTIVDVPDYSGSYASATFSADVEDNFITVNEATWKKIKGGELLSVKDSGGSVIINQNNVIDAQRFTPHTESTNFRIYIDGVPPAKVSKSVTFSATNGDATITVSCTSHGASANDRVLFAGATSLGGNITATVLNKGYTIATVVDANSFTIEATDLNLTTVLANSSDTGNGGGSAVGKFMYADESGLFLAQTRRLQCDGVLDTNETVLDNARDLLSNMRGFLNYIDGKYSVLVEDATSSSFSITDDHIIDQGIKIRYEDKAEKLNKVVVQFFNAQKKYESDTKTVFHNNSTSTYKNDDGGEELETTAEFQYITNPYNAFNMGKGILERSRRQKTVSFIGTPRLLNLTAGDVVSITYTPYNLSNAAYRIETINLLDNGLVGIQAIEYFDLYTWSATPPEENVGADPDLPTGTEAEPPTNLTFTDATSTRRAFLTWTAATNYPAKEFRVIIKNSSGQEIHNRIVSDAFIDLDFIAKANGYVASITSISSTGAESSATSITFNVTQQPVKLGDIQANVITATEIQTGTLTSASGVFGAISADDITTGTLDAANVTVSGGDVTINNSGISINGSSSSINLGSGAFTVSSSGVMTATGATVSGAITASSLNVTGATVTGTIDASKITLNGDPLTDIFALASDTEGENILLKESGTSYGSLIKSGSNFKIKSMVNNGDIKLSGIDGGVPRDALTLDMSLEGAATFHSTQPASFGGHLTIGGAITVFQNVLTSTNALKLNSGQSSITLFNTNTFNAIYEAGNHIFKDASGSNERFRITGTGLIGLGGANYGTSGQVLTSNGSSTPPTWQSTGNVVASYSNGVNNRLVTSTGAAGINGESNLTFDGSTLNVTGNIIVSNDLTVQGTTTTIDTTNLDVKDKNITLNFATGDSSANADGAGITIQDAVDASTDATILWDATNDEFDFSHKINVTGSITSDGVAITDDAANLSIQNAAADTGQKFRRNGNNDLIIERFASGSTSETARIDSSGNATFAGNISVAGTTVLTGDTRIGSANPSGTHALKVYHTDNFEAAKFETNQGGSLARFTCDNTNASIEIGNQSGEAVLRTGNSVRLAANVNGDVRIATGHLQMGSTTIITSGTRNIQNIGTISSGAITSSGNVTVQSGGVLQLRPTDSSDTDAWLLYQYTDNTFRINFTGAGADEFTLTSSGNATFAGTINSGAITSSGLIRSNNSNYYGKVDAAVNYRGFGDVPIMTGVSGATYLYAGGSTSVCLTLQSSRTIAPQLAIGQVNNFTTIIDSSRNISNIGTISSGAITSTGNITTDWNDTISMNYAPSLGSYHKGMSGTSFASGNTARGLHLFNFDNDTNLGINFWVGTTASKVFAARIDSSGRVGIGTTSPSQKLEVHGAIRFGDTVSDVADGGRPLIYASDGTGSHTGHALVIQARDGAGSEIDFVTGTTPTTRMHIDSSGRVGIGTTTPAKALQVKTDTNGDGINIQRNSTTADHYGQLSFSVSTNDVYTTPNVWIRGVRGSTYSNNFITFGTGGSTGTERFRIDASGNFQIGTSATTIIDANRNIRNLASLSMHDNILRLRSNGDGNHYLQYKATGHSGVAIDGAQLQGHQGGELTTNLGGNNYSLRWNNSGDIIVRNAITAGGDITAFSDERLKDNIQTLDGKKALQMRGVSFTKDGKEGSGVIAQEIEKIAPELVLTADDEQGTKSVAYGNLVGYLIEAIKEQQEQIEELKAKLEEVA